jgi:hypothetical protein
MTKGAYFRGRPGRIASVIGPLEWKGSTSERELERVARGVKVNRITVRNCKLLISKASNK